MYSHKSYRCMYICMHGKQRQNKKKRYPRKKEQSNSKEMNGLQRESVCVKRRLCSMLIGEQALFFFVFNNKKKDVLIDHT